MGIALPGSAGAPAPYDSRDHYGETSGQAVMDLLAKGIRPRDIVTKAALTNAAVVVAATGGSTNAALHLPAIANEAGIELDLHDVAQIFRKTPYIANLKPGGKYVAKDLYEVGGVQVVIKELLDGGYLDGDCLTVTGKTLAQNHEKITFPEDQDVVYRVKSPISPTGGVVGLKGNLAPRRRNRQESPASRRRRQSFRGPARCFDCEEDAFTAVMTSAIKEGDCIVIRYEGPKGGPGMREMLSTTAALYGLEMENVALITDGRFLGRDPGPVRRPYRGPKPPSAGRSACSRMATSWSSTPRPASWTSSSRRRNSSSAEKTGNRAKTIIARAPCGATPRP